MSDVIWSTKNIGLVVVYMYILSRNCGSTWNISYPKDIYGVEEDSQLNKQHQVACAHVMLYL